MMNVSPKKYAMLGGIDSISHSVIKIYYVTCLTSVPNKLFDAVMPMAFVRQIP